MSSDPIRAAVQEAIDCIDGATDSDDLAIRACQVVTALRAALAAAPEGERLPSDEGYESGAMFTGHPLRPATPLAPLEGEGSREEPNVDDVLELAAIIRKVDGSHSLGAAALAEAILARWGRPAAPPAPLEGEVVAATQRLEALAAFMEPGSQDRWVVENAASLLAQISGAFQALVPIPVSEQPWERPGWCDEQGRCWLGSVGSRGNDPGWVYRKPCEVLHQTISLPHHALPLPAPAPQGGEAMTECLPDLPRYIRRRDNEWQGADHPNGPWRPIPAPQQALPWPTDGPAVPESREPASVAPEATAPRPLSPAAQAVLDAVCKNTEPDCDTQHLIAAALRAVADQVVPEPSDCGPASHDYIKGADDRQKIVRFRLLALAAELEGCDA